MVKHSSHSQRTHELMILDLMSSYQQWLRLVWHNQYPLIGTGKLRKHECYKQGLTMHKVKQMGGSEKKHILWAVTYHAKARKSFLTYLQTLAG